MMLLLVTLRVIAVSSACVMLKMVKKSKVVTVLHLHSILITVSGPKVECFDSRILFCQNLNLKPLYLI